MVKGACMAKGGMHGKGEGAWHEGCAWQKGGMRGEGGAWQRGHAWYAHPPSMIYGRSMRGRYASYWNAFLFFFENSKIPCRL